MRSLIGVSDLSRTSGRSACETRKASCRGFVGHCRASLVEWDLGVWISGHGVLLASRDRAMGAEQCSSSASAMLIGCPVWRS